MKTLGEFHFALLRLKKRKRFLRFGYGAQHLAGDTHGKRSDRFIASDFGISKRTKADTLEKFRYHSARDYLRAEWPGNEFGALGLRQVDPGREPGARRLSEPHGTRVE